MILLLAIFNYFQYTYYNLSSCLWNQYFTDADYSISSKHISIRPGVTNYAIAVTARQDSILEDKKESFIVRATAPSVPANNPYCDTTVNICDDDGRLLII